MNIFQPILLTVIRGQPAQFGQFIVIGFSQLDQKSFSVRRGKRENRYCTTPTCLLWQQTRDCCPLKSRCFQSYHITFGSLFGKKYVHNLLEDIELFNRNTSWASPVAGWCHSGESNVINLGCRGKSGIQLPTRLKSPFLRRTQLRLSATLLGSHELYNAWLSYAWNTFVRWPAIPSLLPDISAIILYFNHPNCIGTLQLKLPL